MAAPNQTLQSIVDAAIFICGKEFDNTDVISESLVPVVFREVSRRYAADPIRRPLTLRTFDITFTNGEGTLPPEVLIAYLASGVMALDSTPEFTPQWRYVSWLEFTRPLTANVLGYFSVNTDMGASTDALIYLTEPGTAYVPGSGPSGVYHLTTPASVSIPAAAADEVTAPQELQVDLILGLSRALKGEWISAETTP